MSDYPKITVYGSALVRVAHSPTRLDLLEVLEEDDGLIVIRDISRDWAEDERPSVGVSAIAVPALIAALRYAASAHTDRHAGDTLEPTP